MSGVGFSELIILFLIGLIVLGPERLPRVANQLGSWLGQARRMTRVMKRQLEEELDLESGNTIRPNYPTSRAEQFPPKAAAATTSTEQAAEADSVPDGEPDDTWSPAHDADAPGTGVDTEEAESENPDEPASEQAPAQSEAKSK